MKISRQTIEILIPLPRPSIYIKATFYQRSHYASMHP